MKFPILLFIIVILTGCDPERTVIYSTKDCVGNYQPTSLNLITSSTQKFDGTYVEVTGFYHQGFERSALSNSKISQYEKSMLWVDFVSSVIDSLEKDKIIYASVFKNLSGKKIKIRGEINSKDGGHLGQYAATIKNVCYLEIYKW